LLAGALALAWLPACGNPSAEDYRFQVGPEAKKLPEKFQAKIKALKPRRGKVGKAIREQKNYFANQAERMNYEETAQRGWPIGSGAVESACRQSQCRFKRAGQFWTQRGLRHLSALDEARRNDHWDELWLTA